MEKWWYLVLRGRFKLIESESIVNCILSSIIKCSQLCVLKQQIALSLSSTLLLVTVANSYEFWQNVPYIWSFLWTAWFFFVKCSPKVVKTGWILFLWELIVTWIKHFYLPKLLNYAVTWFNRAVVTANRSKRFWQSTQKRKAQFKTFTLL